LSFATLGGFLIVCQIAECCFEITISSHANILNLLLSFGSKELYSTRSPSIDIKLSSSKVDRLPAAMASMQITCHQPWNHFADGKIRIHSRPAAYISTD
jgi:hypothetical protein